MSTMISVSVDRFKHINFRKPLSVGDIACIKTTLKEFVKLEADNARLKEEIERLRPLTPAERAC